MGDPKAFLTIHRKEAGYRPIHERIHDFSQVEQTLNTHDRRLQASRCMACGVPFFYCACPLGNRQPEWQDALYKGKYMLGTSLARPIIAKKLVDIALEEGADAICHGRTGKGNDQVRFELAIKAFAPDMPIIAPWREWDIKSREEEIEYAEARKIPLKINRETNYSKDKNLWHLSHEGLDLENPANEPKYDEILEMGVSPEKAPDVPTYITLTFEKGEAVALNGEKPCQ